MNERGDGRAVWGGEIGALSERFEDVLEAIPVAFFVMDGDSRLSFINGQAETLMRRPREWLMGKRLWEEFPQAVDTALYPAVMRAIAEQTTVEVEDYYPPYDSWYAGVAYPVGNGVAVFFRDITERKGSDEALRRKDTVLEAVRFAADAFLRDPSWTDGIRQVLARLGDATGVSRVSLFENHQGPDGISRHRQRYEWSAEGVEASIDDSLLQDFSFDEHGMGRWEDALRSGEVIHGPKGQLPREERRVLEAQDVMSILVVPIFAGREWWGFMRFDDCLAEREWSAAEIDALKAAAGTLGAAVGHARSEEASRNSADLFQATIESTADGMLVVDNEGTTLLSNSRFAQMWRIPFDLLESKSDEQLLIFVLDQLVEPEAFLSKIKELYQSSRESFDMLLLQDGRVFERFSRPLMHEGQIAGRVWSFRDVTERRRAEEQLRAAEARYRTLVEQLPVVVHSYAVDTSPSRPTYISPQVEALFGYTPEQWLADPLMWVTSIHEDDRDRVVAEDARTSRSGEPFSMEYRVVARDGRIVWVRDEAVMMMDDAGRPLFWRGVLMDVTERKEAEAELERSRVLLTESQRLAHIGSWEWDVPTNVATWSDELCRIYGIEPGTHLSYERFLEAVPPDDQEMVRRSVERAFATHESFGFDHRIVRPDGEVRTLRAAGRVVTNDAGEVIRMFGTGQDISERKQAEEAVRDAEAKYRTLVEQMPAITYVDLAEQPGLPAYTNVYISPQVERILGYSSEDFRDDPELWARLVHPDDRERSLAEDTAHHATGEPLNTEYRVVARDGRVVWLHDMAVMVRDESGRPKFSHGVQFDITEGKRAEAQLQESFELLRRSDEERRRLLDRVVKAQEDERRRIAANIHDDSIQKMTAVGLRLQALRRRIDEPGRMEMLHRLEETVELAINRLRRLMFELRPPALDREGLATALQQHLSELASESELAAHLENQIVTEPPGGIPATAYRIAQEALANVRKHARARRLDVLLESREDGLFVRIRDDGVGFDQSLAESASGHLGLSAMRERAEFAGGWWRIESAPGTGTTVEFWLPCEPEGVVEIA